MGSIVEEDSLSTSVTELPADENPTGEKVNPRPSLSSSSSASLGKSSNKSHKNNNGGVEVVPPPPPSSSSASLTVPVPVPANGGSTGGGANNSSNSTRRIFTSAFKQTVLEAYISDPDCIGNQRATARKFNIHRRQVQKWLTQLDKEGEGSQSSSPDQIINQARSSVSNSSTLETSSSNSPSSSSEKERDVEEQQNQEEPVVGTNPQVDRSPSSSSSSSSSKPQVDLCTMSSAAMAMSLNLTHNPTTTNLIPNSIGNQKQLQLQFHHDHSERTRNNSSSPTLTPSLPSPNSLLSKFYSLYAQGQGHQGSSSSAPKYQGLNLNGDSTKGNPNLTSPQNRAHPIPQRHPPVQHPRNHQRQSNGGGGGSNSYHIQILDEISSAYPHDDFSLLRQALLRNEVSFTKVSSSAPKSTFFPPPQDNRSPENNGGTSWGNNGRTSSPTPVSPKNPNQQNNLALELLRQQTEYVRLIQQSGLNFSDLSPEGMKGIGNSSSSKYPWLSPFAQAAATLGLPLMGTTPLNGQKKQSPPPHVFVSPKPPSGSKPKTVAAALAATRNSPNSLLSQFAAAGAFDPAGAPKKRSTAPRKRGKPRQNPKPSCTITRPQDEDFMDPTSMLEVTTCTGSERILSNGMGYPPVNGNGNHFLHSMLQQQESESDIHGNRVGSPEDSEIKKYLEQHNEQKSPSTSEPDAEQITKAMALEAFTYDPEVTGDCRAVARKFGLNVRVVMKWIKEGSGKTNQHLTNIYDNFGLKPTNGNGDIYHPEQHEPPIKTNGDLRYDDPIRIHHQQLPNIPTSSNKRKTSKPNQICDFQQEEDDDLGFGDVPLDMMIPIKKRRVSSQQ